MFEPLFTEESPNTFIYIWAFGRSRTCNLLITNQLLCQLSYEGIFYVKMDKLYLHFTQCFSLDYHQQHRIGCFLTLLSTTLLVVTLPPLTRFIFILICTWIGFSYVTPQTTFLPFLMTIQLHFTIVFNSFSFQCISTITPTTEVASKKSFSILLH